MSEPKPTKRRGGGSKLARSEQVSIRLDPKLRFAAELAASKERRTLSSFIEWAVETAVKKITLVYLDDERYQTANDVAAAVWDVDAPDRFIKLAIHYPEFLTHDEQRKWKFLKETEEFWVPVAETTKDGVSVYFDSRPRSPNLPVIRLAWDLIEEHIDEGQVFDWNRFVTRVEEAYPRVQIHHYSDVKRFTEALGYWAGRMLETETDPKTRAWLEKCRQELGGSTDGA